VSDRQSEDIQKVSQHGTVASHSVPDAQPFVVAPTATDLFNTFGLDIVPVACMSLNDIGGQIALRLAFKHPELERRVVVSGVAFGPGSEMLNPLADTANFTNRAARGKAEYARVSPDGPDHWSTYVDKTRAMWSKSVRGISEAELACIKLPPPENPTIIRPLLTALDQKFCNHGQRIWTRELAAAQ
jgi:pimeloyl-ACP methyl ester carboxylesterase